MRAELVRCKRFSRCAEPTEAYPCDGERKLLTRPLLEAEYFKLTNGKYIRATKPKDVTLTAEQKEKARELIHTHEEILKRQEPLLDAVRITLARGGQTVSSVRLTRSASEMKARLYSRQLRMRERKTYADLGMSLSYCWNCQWGILQQPRSLPTTPLTGWAARRSPLTRSELDCHQRVPA